MTKGQVEEMAREEVKKGYRCEYCGATKRANVYVEQVRFEWKVEIECTGFLPGGIEMCGNTQVRWYA